jgi:hypothetical protein
MKIWRQGIWRHWVERCDREMDPRPLAALRILIPLCVLLDLSRVAKLGLTDHLFRTYAEGGISRIQHHQLFITDWFGSSAGPAAMVITMVCMALISAGVWVRPAILVGVTAYAQMGHLFPPGDRAVDRLLRTALLILLFSGAHKCWTLRGGTRPIRIPGWPADKYRMTSTNLMRSAGLAKIIQQPGWFNPATDPPLLRILIDPLSGHLDPATWAQWPWLFRLGSWATIIIEVSAPLLLTRYARYWAVLGVSMHLLIALTMDLGMFSWGCLAFYPLLLEPWFTRFIDRD